MRPKLKVLFLGNHTVGVRVLHSLAAHAHLCGVVAHPSDPEDGVRYESVANAAASMGVRCLRASGRSPELRDFILQQAPELLWITDYRYLLPAEVLALAPLGAINLHPSLLPKYRGRAPLNWAILHGESRLGLTAHFVTAGMDDGDIIAQHAFELNQSQDVGDALELLYPLYARITAEVLDLLGRGCVSRRMQDESQATAFPRRTPEDGVIDWSQPARGVWNLVRAVAAPYPGAFSQREEGLLRIWKAEGIRPFDRTESPLPGLVEQVELPHGRLSIACADAWLMVTRWDCEGGGKPLQAGEVLGAVQTISSLEANT